MSFTLLLGGARAKSTSRSGWRPPGHPVVVVGDPGAERRGDGGADPAPPGRSPGALDDAGGTARPRRRDRRRRSGRVRRPGLPLALESSNALEAGASDDRIADDARIVSERLRGRNGAGVVVTNEVGLGIVPMNELARRYRDVLGRANATRSRTPRASTWRPGRCSGWRSRRPREESPRPRWPRSLRRPGRPRRPRGSSMRRRNLPGALAASEYLARRLAVTRGGVPAEPPARVAVAAADHGVSEEGGARIRKGCRPRCWGIRRRWCRRLRARGRAGARLVVVDAGVTRQRPRGCSAHGPPTGGGDGNTASGPAMPPDVAVDLIERGDRARGGALTTGPGSSASGTWASRTRRRRARCARPCCPPSCRRGAPAPA